jgi:hypothetical protein
MKREKKKKQETDDVEEVESRINNISCIQIVNENKTDRDFFSSDASLMMLFDHEKKQHDINIR